MGSRSRSKETAIAEEDQHDHGQPQRQVDDARVAQDVDDLLAGEGADAAAGSRGPAAAWRRAGLARAVHHLEEDVLERGFELVDLDAPGSRQRRAAASSLGRELRRPRARGSRRRRARRRTTPGTPAARSRRLRAGSAHVEQASRHVAALERRGRVERGEAAVDHQPDAVAVLGLVQVVGGDEDGGARPRARRRMSRQKLRRATGSTPAVGSSRNTMRGWCRMAQPSASRWRSRRAASPVTALALRGQADLRQHLLGALPSAPPVRGRRRRRRSRRFSSTDRSR